MIPKIIHCVWLSNEPLPPIYAKCKESWSKIMPDYEVKVWTKDNFPTNDYQFVKEACDAKKWAYATDFIRLWALYNYGGIYLDMDVFVFKPFDIFLEHRAFSCIDYDPNEYFLSIKKGKEIKGVAIEAAVLGAEKEHPWIKDVMNFYSNRHFINTQEYCRSIIMPKVMKDISVKKYGYKLMPKFQILKEGVHIYPADTFSFLANLAIEGIETTYDYKINVASQNLLRYSVHLCAHSWWEDTSTKTLMYKIKHPFVLLLGHSRITAIKKLLGLNKKNGYY